MAFGDNIIKVHGRSPQELLPLMRERLMIIRQRRSTINVMTIRKMTLELHTLATHYKKMHEKGKGSFINPLPKEYEEYLKEKYAWPKKK